MPDKSYFIQHSDSAPLVKCQMGRQLLALTSTVLVALITWYAIQNQHIEKLCSVDLERDEVEKCRLLCPHGYFNLVEMKECLPWLTCTDFATIDTLLMIGGGAVKAVYLAKWQGHEMVLNKLAEPLYREDFQHGLQMLASFSPHPYVTQLVGHCKDEYITEYHRHRSAEYLIELLQNEKLRKYDTLARRFSLCINYVELLVFLHNSSLGTRVMCDSNDLSKTLNQLLVTVDLRLILNDLDALPEVILPNGKIKCGQREIVGDFAAPEQRWLFGDRPFDDSDLQPYDEKSDVWKIPDVCQFFLQNHPDTKSLVFHLFKIHQKCKIENPAFRTSAVDVLLEYKEVYKKLGL